MISKYFSNGSLASTTVSGVCSSCQYSYKKNIYFFKEQKVCRICYAVINPYNYNNNFVDVYYSNMDQLEIVKGTIDFLIKNGRHPKPFEIDPQVKLSILNLHEFLNVFNSGLLDECLSEFKLFPNEKLNISSMLYDKVKVCFFREDENVDYVYSTPIIDDKLEKVLEYFRSMA